MSYYQEPESEISIRIVKSCYLKKLNDVSVVDTSNLAATRHFIDLKAEVDMLDINMLVNIPTNLNNLKTKVGDLDVDKLTKDSVDMKNLSHVVSKEVVEMTMGNKLNMKVKNSGNKILHVTLLIQVNQ